MRTFTIICSLCVWYAAIANADLYQWTDADGVIHIVDETVEIPDAYREELKVYRTATPTVSAEPSVALLAPSRIYAAKSQGEFAQKLALDLGLIKSRAEDALGPLSGVGIQPAGGWKVGDPLTPAALYEVLAAARRAADSRRLSLSADGAEAVVHQTAAAFLPPPPVTSPYQDRDEEEPEVVIIEQPPEIIEVVREPYYVPFPVVVGSSGFLHRRPRRHQRTHPQHGSVSIPAPSGRPSPSATTPPTIRPGLAPLPVRASHLPVRTSRLPVRSSHPLSRSLRR